VTVAVVDVTGCDVLSVTEIETKLLEIATSKLKKAGGKAQDLQCVGDAKESNILSLETGRSKAFIYCVY
jgi:hypothetical protein